MEYGSTSSLYEQLLQMRQTGVFIAVHTSNLANAPLLQPGSAVIEIIQVGQQSGVMKGRAGKDLEVADISCSCQSDVGVSLSGSKHIELDTAGF